MYFISSEHRLASFMLNSIVNFVKSNHFFISCSLLILIEEAQIGFIQSILNLQPLLRLSSWFTPIILDLRRMNVRDKLLHCLRTCREISVSESIPFIMILQYIERIFDLGYYAWLLFHCLLDCYRFLIFEIRLSQMKQIKVVNYLHRLQKRRRWPWGKKELPHSWILHNACRWQHSLCVKLLTHVKGWMRWWLLCLLPSICLNLRVLKQWPLLLFEIRVCLFNTQSVY